ERQPTMRVWVERVEQYSALLEVDCLSQTPQTSCQNRGRPDNPQIARRELQRPAYGSNCHFPVPVVGHLDPAQCDVALCEVWLEFKSPLCCVLCKVKALRS